MMRVHRYGEWSIVALCISSYLAYLHHSRAVEAYLALYAALLQKVPMLLGR